MLHERGNNFFDACDFKALGMGRCGQKMAFRNFRATSLSIGREIHLGRIFFTDFNKLNGVQQKRDAAFPVIGDTIAIVLVATPPRQRAIAQRFRAVGPTRKGPGPPTESAHRGEPENICSF
jgi:hypothetical protein